MTYIAYKSFNFRRATLAIIDKANAIIEEYQAAGYTLTLRQLYYQFVATVPGFENSEKSYKNLGNIINDGRLAGLISWDAIEDRGRGVKPWLIQENEADVFDGIEYHFARDYWTPQDFYVECWVEKEALASVIERACNRYRVPYMSCKGYLSASEAWRAGQRFEEAIDAGKQVKVIHLGDHDPSGRDMTRDNLERLELFTNGYGVEVERIALNIDQVRQYNPPPNPTKLTDTRAGEYIAEFGHTCWELDALRPQVIEQLIKDAIECCITDHAAWTETQDDERQRRRQLKKLHRNWDEVSNFLQGLE